MARQRGFPEGYRRGCRSGRKSGRLVIEVGDQMLSAFTVPAPLEGDDVQHVLPVGAHAQMVD
jgi:hypothetical protein